MRRLAILIQLVGVIVLGYCAFYLLRAEIFQAYQNWTFERSRQNQQLAARGSATLSSTGSSRPRLHSVIGRIEIPRLGLSTMVLEGDEERQFELGAGHLPGTALPGESGNVVIAAHRDTFFRPMEKISKDDHILLTTLHGTYEYKVDSLEITVPENTLPLKRVDEPVLTLITCYPFHYVGPAPKRFIVRARRVS